MKQTLQTQGRCRGKCLLVLTCALLSSGLLGAQSITWTFVNAAGFEDGPDGSLRWTIGEPLTVEVGDKTATLRVGFLPFAYVEQTSASTALSRDIEIVISPNPASDQIDLRVPGLQRYDIRILSVSGNAALATGVISQAQIDIRSLPDGAYVLYAIDPDGNFNTKTFIKS